MPKVSEQPAATSTGGSDVLYLVQSGASKHVTLATLFANASNVTLKGNVYLDPNVQVMTSPGVIDVSRPVTHINSTAETHDNEIFIPYGREGQIKIIAKISDTESLWELRSNVAGHGNTDHTVQFFLKGDTVLLMFAGTRWYMLGGTASVYDGG